MNNITFDYTDKTVLVIGGSRGIGKGVVEKFIDSNANVYYVSRRENKDIGNNANYIKCNIEQKKDIDRVFNILPKLDFLVNVAAINYCKKINDIEFEEWDEVININLRSYYYIIKKSLEMMNEYSKIVNVSSIAGRHRSPVSGVHYVSSKSGIIGLTKQIAFEVAERKINVNCVCPSQTLTDMLVSSMSEQELNNLSQVIPLKRLATIEDQVYPILFLCSNEAAYITGAVIDVNGGQI